MGTSGSGSFTGDGIIVGTSSGGGGMLETAVRVGCSFTNGGGGTVKAGRRIGRMGSTGGVIAGTAAGGLVQRLDDFDDRFTGERERDRDVEEAADVEAGDVEELLDDVVIFRRRRRRADASDDDDEADELL